jgi:hypothetical protein
MMTMITPEERRTGLAVVVVLVVIGLVFHKVETLVAGLLGLLAGIIAYVGALRAAERQVSATQEAAAKQVAAMQSQLDDVRAARQEEEAHAREVERAYVSGGGARLIVQRQAPDDLASGVYEQSVGVIELADGTRVLRLPTDLFELHINNHGKTPARLHHVAIGFRNAAALPSVASVKLV